MTLSHATRNAVLEVVRRLRDPMLIIHVDSIGYEILWAHVGPPRVALDEVRAALGMEGKCALANWARGKSREEVAKALERIATSEADPR